MGAPLRPRAYFRCGSSTAAVLQALTPESFCAEPHGLSKEYIHIVLSMQRAAATKSSTAGMLQVPAARPLADVSIQQAAKVLTFGGKASPCLDRARLYSSKQRVLENELGFPHLLPTVSDGMQCIHAGAVLFIGCASFQLPAVAHIHSICLVPDNQGCQCRLEWPCTRQCTSLVRRQTAISLLKMDAQAQVVKLFNASVQCFWMTLPCFVLQGLDDGTPAKVFSSSSRLTVQDKAKCMGWAQQLLTSTPGCMVSHACVGVLQALLLTVSSCRDSKQLPRHSFRVRFTFQQSPGCCSSRLTGSLLTETLMTASLCNKLCNGLLLLFLVAG